MRYISCFFFLTIRFHSAFIFRAVFFEIQVPSFTCNTWIQW